MKRIRSSHQNPPHSEPFIDQDFEQFQRLSAYFDGEATLDERREIQRLLDTDANVKRQYQQLRQLRQALQLIPIPASISAQYLGQRVLAKLRRTQLKTFSLWGSGAIAALLVAGFVGQGPQWSRDLLNRHLPGNNVSTSSGNEEALVVAINRPVLQIPKLVDIPERP
jgi:anti-sigma factor RsiW